MDNSEVVHNAVENFPLFYVRDSGSLKNEKNEILFTGACKGLRIMRDYGIII